MKIVVIGAGNVGRALAGSLVRAGHSVIVSSTNPEHAELVARDTGAQAAGSNRDAVESGEVVILAVPYSAIPALLTELGDVLQGKILVDATNPLNPDLSLAVEGTSAAEEIQARVPKASVAKAFNTVLVARQSEPVVDGVQLDGFVAADDLKAKAVTLELVRSMGLRSIDAGPLRMARALEAMALLNISLQVSNGWSWQTGWKLVGPTAGA